MSRPAVTHLCCVDSDAPDGPVLVAVIWGRIFWKPLRAGWLAGKWVPLELPGEGEPEIQESITAGFETHRNKAPHRRKGKRVSPKS